MEGLSAFLHLESTIPILADMEHVRTKFLYAAYGGLLLGGVLHFGIDVVAQCLRGKRAPGPETTLFYGLNTAYALGQVMIGVLALLVLRSGSPVLGRWPALTPGFAVAVSSFAVCILFLEYTQPRSVVVVFAVLLGLAACTLLKEIHMKLSNQTVLITGGTSGIGFELAKQLLLRGNEVIVTGREQSRLDETKRSLPGLHTFLSDVSDPEAIANLYSRVVSTFPALNVLMNNAGIMRNLSLKQERGLDDITREIDTNLSGPVRMIQQFLGHLETMPEALIVNVSSGLAFIPMPASPVYCATKAAMHSFTQSLRAQLQGTQVSVVELAPPGTETPLLRREFEAEMKGQKGMDVGVLVRKAIAGIEAGRVEIRPGLSDVLYAMSRIAPRFMLKQMVKMTQPRS